MGYRDADTVLYDDLLKEARNMFEKGEYSNAIDACRLAYDMCPNSKLQRKITRIESFVNKKKLDSTATSDNSNSKDITKEEGSNSSCKESTDISNIARKERHILSNNYNSVNVIGNEKKERARREPDKTNKNWNRLYLHQRQGLEWLRQLYRQGKGGILADDMGLGKTIQIVVFLAELLATERIKSAVIAMPVSVLMTWQREFEVWCPESRVLTFHDQSRRERDRILAKVQRRGGVMLTTYGIIVSSWEDLGGDFEWDYVVLDEGHKIKNPSSKTAKAVRALRAKNRLILTGTAVQNNLKELWALFDFVHHGTLLGSQQTFKLDYSGPIERARQKDASGAEQRHGAKMAESLRRIIQPYFLRRTKHQVTCSVPTDQENEESHSPNGTKVLKMPKFTRKNDLIVWVFLTEVQEKIYREFLQLDSVKSLLTRSEKRSPLVELTILKKLCDHPRLLSEDQCSDLGLEGAALSGATARGAGDAASFLPENVVLQESGKLCLLVKLVNHLREDGHRCLIFSQSRKMLDMIQRVLRYYGDHDILRLDGTVTKLSERQELISRFTKQTHYSVFLLTTQVGGVGLTLTAADRVIIFDPSWNPATDAQAVDRVFRIGQTKNVVIYRLITCGTVEEKIYRRQIFKDSITRQTTGIQQTDNNPYRYFSRQDLHELFALSDPRHSATQVQLAELHLNQRRSDEELDEHLAFLHSLDIFGLSDHDLMFSKEDQVQSPVHEQELHVADNLCQQAELRLAKESQNNNNERELQYEMSRLDLTGHPLMNSTTIAQRSRWNPPAGPPASLSTAVGGDGRSGAGVSVFVPRPEDTKRPVFNRPLVQQPLTFNFHRQPPPSAAATAMQSLLRPPMQNKPLAPPEVPLFKPDIPRTVPKPALQLVDKLDLPEPLKPEPLTLKSDVSVPIAKPAPPLSPQQPPVTNGAHDSFSVPRTPIVVISSDSESESSEESNSDEEHGIELVGDSVADDVISDSESSSREDELNIDNQINVANRETSKDSVSNADEIGGVVAESDPEEIISESEVEEELNNDDQNNVTNSEASRIYDNKEPKNFIQYDSGINKKDQNNSDSNEEENEDIIEMDLTQEIEEDRLMKAIAKNSFRDILRKSMLEGSTVLIDDSLNSSVYNNSTVFIEDSVMESPYPHGGKTAPLQYSTPLHNDPASPMVIGMTPAAYSFVTASDSMKSVDNEGDL